MLLILISSSAGTILVEISVKLCSTRAHGISLAHVVAKYCSEILANFVAKTSWPFGIGKMFLFYTKCSRNSMAIFENLQLHVGNFFQLHTICSLFKFLPTNLIQDVNFQSATCVILFSHQVVYASCELWFHIAICNAYTCFHFS